MQDVWMRDAGMALCIDALRLSLVQYSEIPHPLFLVHCQNHAFPGTANTSLVAYNTSLFINVDKSPNFPHVKSKKNQ